MNSEAVLEYAVNWFTYHAQQRLATFNFFLVIEGAIFAAYLKAIDGSWRGLGIFTSSLGVIAAGAFYLLELRNTELVNCGRDALDELEKQMPKAVRVRYMDDKRLKLKSAMGPSNRRGLWRHLQLNLPEDLIRHGIVLRGAQAFLAIFFLLATVNAVLAFPVGIPTTAAESRGGKENQSSSTPASKAKVSPARTPLTPSPSSIPRGGGR